MLRINNHYVVSYIFCMVVNGLSFPLKDLANITSKSATNLISPINEVPKSCVCFEALRGTICKRHYPAFTFSHVSGYALQCFSQVMERREGARFQRNLLFTNPTWLKNLSNGFGDHSFGYGRAMSCSLSSSPVQSHLPGYLLGGNSQSASPMSRNWSTPLQHSSPAIRNTPASSGASSGFSSPHKQLILTEKLQQNTTRGTPTIGRTPKDAIGAPPVEGLYDTRHASPAPVNFQCNQSQWAGDRSQIMSATPNRFPSYASGPGTPFQNSRQDTSVFSPSKMTLSPSPTQVDPFYTQGEILSSDDVLSQCWVTVFGFPPAATSYILQQFAQYGNIIRHEVVANKNWMHIQYQSKLQAKKALSKNGKVYSSNIMIGVMPCIEKSLMEDCGKENTMRHMETSKMDVSVNPATPSRLPIRPLTAAYQAASSNHQVVPQDGRTPQKNNNVISKAMEYMFGW